MRTGNGIWLALQQARRDGIEASGGIVLPAIGAAWTRRRVLQALAASGMAAALPAPVFALPNNARVAIIGGGIAGLSALIHLTDAGIDARLYEARKRVGGRIHTVTHKDGSRFDRGAQLVNSDHADIHGLCRRYGLSLIDRKEGEHRTIVTVDGVPVPHERLVTALSGIAAQIDSDAARLDSNYARVAPEIDRLSIADYLDRHQALIPEPWVRHLLEQTSRTEYGAEPDRASAIELLFNLPVVDGERVELLGASDERYLIDGGSSALIDAISGAHANRIERDRDCIRIERSRGRLHITFRDLSTVAADHVILAVPAPILQFIELAVPLSGQWRAFINRVELGRNEKVQAVIAGAPWRTAIGPGGELWPADAAAEIASCWDGTVPGGDAAAVWTWFFGGHADTCRPHPPIEDLQAQIVAALPGMATADIGAIDRSAWGRDPYSRGAYVNYPPGMLTRFAELLWVESNAGSADRIAGTRDLLFAGEHLSDAFPGYMNGAAQTGRLAASALIGKPVPANGA